MSERVFEGAVRVEQIFDVGMVTLRGDQKSKALKDAVAASLGVAIPKLREINHDGGKSLAWMSPDEMLALVSRDDAEGLVKRLEAELGAAHALVVNVSDARALFRLTGKGVREVIAKGAPVDMSREGLKAGQIRRTRLGQVAAAFWISGENQIDLVCFRSVSEFVFDWLSVAAQKDSLPEFL